MCQAVKKRVQQRSPRVRRVLRGCQRQRSTRWRWSPDVEFNPEDGEHVGMRGLDPHLVGLGLDPQKLSLALFTDAELINDAINFQKGRSFGNKHNTYTRNFLSFAAQLTREKVDFLCQFPEFGKRLDRPVLTPAAWSEKCREAHERINNIIKRIFGGRKKNKQKTPPQSRDTTVEVVKPLIKEREHPISVLHDMAEGLRYDFKRAGTPEDKALLFRNMILVRIVTSNPMRAVNIAEMRYKVGAKGEENEPTNLYKIPGGSYRLKYEVHELKNGEIQGRYDLPVHPDLTGDLDEYFATWRPLLVGAGECNYVFRPSTEGARARLKRKPDLVRKPMGKWAVSNIVLCASEKYVPGCAGFGIHSTRHLVATEFLKHYPGAYDIAATVLHDSVEMVRIAYEWVTPDDKVVFWNDHLTQVLRKLRKEAA
jgi:integrase